MRRLKAHALFLLWKREEEKNRGLPFILTHKCYYDTLLKPKINIYWKFDIKILLKLTLILFQDGYFQFWLRFDRNFAIETNILPYISFIKAEQNEKLTSFIFTIQTYHAVLSTSKYKYTQQSSFKWQIAPINI